MKYTSLHTQLVTERQTWNEMLRTLPYAHVLQTWEWGEFKHHTTGWIPQRFAFKRGSETVAMASIGVRSIGGLRLMYIPKGPALAYDDLKLTAEVLTWLEIYARHHRAIWLKLDPDVIAATGVPNESDDTSHPIGQTVIHALQTRGWRFSHDQVQFRNTICLDLSLSEDDLLAAMSQNTRRKIRTAEKKDVTIRAATLDDLPILYDLYRVTGTRDHFLIRPFDYYQLAWQRFMQANLAHALIAEYEQRPIAHVILFHFGRKCWYFYGASADEERQRMPNYALQWEAMRWAKTQGYALYDMWGAPDEFIETNSMWGVYEFKRGFRGEVMRHIGAWDYAPYPLLYTAYTQVRPRLLNWIRRRQPSEE